MATVPVLTALVFLGQLGAVGAASAAYPGANGRIAFVRGFDVWTVWPDGSAPRRMTFSGVNASPAWSPDGRLIAFESARAGSFDIWVMRADGSHQHRVTFGPTNQTDPTWSPNGRWIAYSDDRGSTEELPLGALFKTRSAKPYGAPIRLTHPVADWPTGMFDTAAAWSPLGATLLFIRNFPCVPCDEGSSSEAMVSATGGEVAYTDTPGDPSASAWAPGGQAYAVATDLDTVFGPDPSQIYIHEANGTLRLLTTALGDVETPAWAPNGRRIAYRYGGAVWTIRRDGTQPRLVIQDATEPDWQPLIG